MDEKATEDYLYSQALRFSQMGMSSIAAYYYGKAEVYRETRTGEMRDYGNA